MRDATPAERAAVAAYRIRCDRAGRISVAACHARTGYDPVAGRRTNLPDRVRGEALARLARKAWSHAGAIAHTLPGEPVRLR